jgi:hypothetical protein
MTLYDAIHREWDKACPAGTHPLERPPHLQGAEDKARQLDQRLSDAIKPWVDQWNDGLISAVELVAYLVSEAGKPE